MNDAPAPPDTASGAKTQFIVQAFRAGKRGALVAEPAILASSAANARLRAEKMAERKAGVVAYQMTADPDAGDYGDPIVLARFGETPEEMG